ncbi:helix-turn-helix domain-containing protein [Sphingopyxis alaskensis]|uniref:helix-turn-helix domain-containing protein n=1 Tax=Sphingopyxis alaskensis TaxID=117207 RepID=UPI0039197EF0
MTPFGKAVRHLRIEREMLLGDMADILHVSASYISQIEMGKKPIPDGFADRVASLFNLEGDALTHLRSEAARSMSEFKIKLEAGASDKDRILANTIALEFARLTPEAKERIQNIVRGSN